MNEQNETYEGEVVENPYGNWSDVDHGWYIGSYAIQDILYGLENKKVRITVEVLEDDDQ